jgi:ribosomal protein S18 acetylase RimI-like enzyme
LILERAAGMIEICKLTNSDDFTALHSVSREFFNEYVAYHQDFFKIDLLSDDDIAAYFCPFCDDNTRQAFIAVEGERKVGYITCYGKDQASYWSIKKVGEISGSMIDPAFRNRGIGQSLLASARKFFSSQGIRYFTLYTSAASKMALEFNAENNMKPLYATLIGET